MRGIDRLNESVTDEHAYVKRHETFRRFYQESLHIIAEGLAHNGVAEEVVERLQIRRAISSAVNAPTRPQMPAPYPQLPRR